MNSSTFSKINEIMLRNDEEIVQREALWVICNAVSGGSTAQVIKIATGGALQSLCRMLAVNNRQVIENALEGILTILRAGRSPVARNAQGKNTMVELILHSGVRRPIEMRRDQYPMAAEILWRYFGFKKPKSMSVVENIEEIGKEDMEAFCEFECAICCEIHIKKDSLKTDCGHVYGKSCYKRWISTANSNKRCPTCRKLAPTVTVYQCFSEKDKLGKQRHLRPPSSRLPVKKQNSNCQYTRILLSSLIDLPPIQSMSLSPVAPQQNRIIAGKR